ncbi:MAG: PDZ domain-containing protein, partial [Verrucomicrobia bacterium]
PARPVTYLGVEVGRATPALSAQLGLPEGQGLIVRFVMPDSPAAKAGLQKHDLLLRLDDQLLIEPRQLSVLVRSHQKGETISLTLLRGGKERTLEVVLGERMEKPHRMRLRVGGPLDFDMDIPLPDVDAIERNVERHMRLYRDRAEALEEAMPHGRHPAAPAAPRVEILHPETQIVLKDEAGELRLKSVDGHRHLVAIDADGREVFSGPVDSEEERRGLPEDLLKRLERLEHMEIVPPTPPEAPLPPLPPTMGADGSGDAI